MDGAERDATSEHRATARGHPLDGPGQSVNLRAGTRQPTPGDSQQAQAGTVRRRDDWIELVKAGKARRPEHAPHAAEHGLKDGPIDWRRQLPGRDGRPIDRPTKPGDYRGDER